MTTEKTTIGETDLVKALSKLQDLAKGSAGGSAPSTKLATEAGEGGPTQLFHTASDSNPTTWAGTTEKQEAWMDHVDANGTDYKAAGKAMAKSIQAKLEKGEALNKNERMFISKGGMKPEFLADKKEDKEVEKAVPAHDDEKEDKKLVREMVKPDAVKKSLVDYAAEDATVSQGLEVSDFLASFAQVVHKSLASMEARITDKVLTAVANSQAENGEVQKSMAEALANLGEVLTAHQQRIDQVEATPARAAKSTLTKSLDAAEAVASEPLAKSLALDVMFELHKKGDVTSQEIVKYDSTGEMTKQTERKVRTHLAGRG